MTKRERPQSLAPGLPRCLRKGRGLLREGRDVGRGAERAREEDAPLHYELEGVVHHQQHRRDDVDEHRDCCALGVSAVTAAFTSTKKLTWQLTVSNNISNTLSVTRFVAQI